MHKLQRGESALETKGQMGSWAPYYDFIMGIITLGKERALRKMTVELAGVKSGDKVLEIGCGTGTLSITAKARAGPTGEVHGIDAAPEMIEAACRKAVRLGVDVTFQVGLIEDIPFPDDRFDVVLCSFMIFHMPDDARRKGVAEVYRVLRPGGQWLIVDLAPPAQPVQRRLANLLLGPMMQHNLGELSPMMREAGFAEIETGQTRLKVVSFVRGKVRKA